MDEKFSHYVAYNEVNIKCIINITFLGGGTLEHFKGYWGSLKPTLRTTALDYYGFVFDFSEHYYQALVASSPLNVSIYCAACRFKVVN